MCFLLFLEPSRCSLHAGVSQLLQPSCHLSRSYASNFCKPLAIKSLSSTSFHLFFGFPLFVPQTSKCSAFTGPLSSFILSTCPNHRNLCSLRNSSNLSTSVISRIFSLFILFFKVFSHIIRNILMSADFNFLSSSLSSPTFSTISSSTSHIAFVLGTSNLQYAFSASNFRNLFKVSPCRSSQLCYSLLTRWATSSVPSTSPR